MSSYTSSSVALSGHPHHHGHLHSHSVHSVSEIGSAAGPIAAAALTLKPRQTSLLTTALGAGSTPIHPFLSSCGGGPAPAGASNTQGDAGQVLEQVLDTWDRVWMGPTSTSPSPAGTSPQAIPSSPSCAHAAAAAAAASAAPMTMPVNNSSTVSKASTPAARDSPVPPLPATPPPPHRPLSMTVPQPRQDAVLTSRLGQTPEDSNPLSIPISMSSSYRSTTNMAASSSARPIQAHHPVIPKNAKDSNDFASVFFSPLPYSYLNMARSDSTDHILVNSVGSPDMTFRNGRLASASSVNHVEWPVDTEVSPTSLAAAAEAAAAANAGGRLPPLPRSSSAQDVTSHGNKRRGFPTFQGSQSSSAGSQLLLGSSGGLSLSHQKPTLLEQALRADEAAATLPLSSLPDANVTINAKVTTCLDNVGKIRSSSASPDSPLTDRDDDPANGLETIEVAIEQPPTTLANGRASPTVETISAASTHHPVMGSAGSRTPSRSSTSGDSPLLLRGNSPRPTSPPFSAHPAVASLAMAGMPIMPGTDLLQATGYGSIAAALETQSQAQQPMRLVAAAAMIPHVDKADKGGEDAYCIVSSGLGAIGVADGVSGWAEEGIDPADYSRTLMQFCSEALHDAGTSADAREVIRYAHKSTVMAGSSTVSLAVMKPHGRLQVANLGDSGVRIIRDGRIIFASAAQQHMFNMPYQLSHPSIIDSPDDADSADVTIVDVLPGDVIVMATDGLYDNMFDDEIAAICYDVLSCKRRSLLLGTADAPPDPEQLAAAAAAQASLDSCLYSVQEAEALALRITRTAHRYAQNPYQRTPWSVASCEQGFGWARYFAKGGGKMDDCTVIVSFVQPDKTVPGDAIPQPQCTGR